MSCETTQWNAVRAAWRGTRRRCRLAWNRDGRTAIPALVIEQQIAPEQAFKAHLPPFPMPVSAAGGAAPKVA